MFDSGLVWVCVYRFIGLSALGSPCVFETNCCWIAVVVFLLFSGGLEFGAVWVWVVMLLFSHLRCHVNRL